MQQAYQALRVISEAQTVHIILVPQPGELMLKELISASAALQAESSEGVKAVVLDFTGQASARSADRPITSELLARAREAVRAIPQPVLAVARASLSEVACQLIGEADFTLIAHEASLHLAGSAQKKEHDTIGGFAAARLGYATWSARAGELNREMERVLDMLRSKSAVALRHAKTSVRLAEQHATTPLEALSQVNRFYLEKVMATEDAREGLQAFLEKRQPNWENR